MYDSCENHWLSEKPEKRFYYIVVRAWACSWCGSARRMNPGATRRMMMMSQIMKAAQWLKSPGLDASARASKFGNTDDQTDRSFSSMLIGCHCAPRSLSHLPISLFPFVFEISLIGSNSPFLCARSKTWRCHLTWVMTTDRPDDTPVFYTTPITLSLSKPYIARNLAIFTPA